MDSSTSGAALVDDERVLLGLTEDDQTPLKPAPWIGPLVALGGMARRYIDGLIGRQLVIAVSVPRRDFAAVLLSCGWVISSPRPRLMQPQELLRCLAPGTPVRAATDQYLFEDRFEQLDGGAEPVARFRNRAWLVSRISAIAPLPSLAEPSRTAVPELGSLGRWASLTGTWHDRLVSSAADLALVGTASRLRADLEVRVAPHHGGSQGDGQCTSTSDAIANLLLPRGAMATTHFSSVHASACLADQLPLPPETQAVVLDGYGAIKYLLEIEAPFVFCVLDRSVADETSAELLVQYRNTRGEPVSLGSSIGWRPPAGVEALAFTTRL